MSKLEVKKMSNPDELRTLPKTRGEVIKVGDNTIMRSTFEPGWKWSECIKPTVGTHSCQVHHVFYLISGSMMIRMDDGTEMEFKSGDAGVIPPGHDAWVTSDTPAVGLDFTGGATYGKK